MFWKRRGKVSAQERAELGRRGEKVAARFLRQRGYRIIQRNWRCQAGEIDLICADGDVLVFVEVKSRREGEGLGPEAGVDRRKQRKLEKLALFYLSGLGLDGIDWRFDVVAVCFGPGRRCHVELFKGAF